MLKTYHAITSAQSVAALRAASNNESNMLIQCPDNYAKLFIDGKYKFLTKLKPSWLRRKIIHKISPGSYEYIIARTKYFDKVLNDEVAKGVEQIVILGAGYDSRAIRFQKDLKDIVIFELDFPATQRKKIVLLKKKISSIPKNINFVPIDFQENDIFEKLKLNNFDFNKKTLFLLEGVSYYLPEKSMKNILKLISSNCMMGSSIVYDYSIKSFVDGDTSTYGAVEVANWLKKINEKFIFGLEPKNMKIFIERCGLSLVEDLGPDDLENYFLKLNRYEIFGKIFGHTRILHTKLLSNKGQFSCSSKENPEAKKYSK